MCEVFGYFSPWSSQHSSVSVVTSPRIARRCSFGSIPSRIKRLLLSSKRPDGIWVPPSSPLWLTKTLFLVAQQPGREGDHLFPSKVEVMNKWSNTSTLLCLHDGTGVVLILLIHSGRRVSLIGYCMQDL